MIINVFRHFDVPRLWYIEISGALSSGMDKATAVSFARTIGRLFEGARVVVRTKPGLTQVVRTKPGLTHKGRTK